MLEFYYEGISREGEKIKGHIEADSEADLRIKLRAKKIRPIKIKEKTNFLKSKISRKKLNKKLSEKEKTIFIKEFLLMIKSDLTIIQALEVLSSDGPSQSIMQISTSIINYMQSGMTFSQALSRFDKYFDNMFLNVVASGEIRGNLNQVLENWISYREEEESLEKIVTRTISYPIVIFGILFLSFLIISIGITPVFEKIYRAYSIKLPSILLTLSMLGNIISYNLTYILIFISLVLGFIFYFVKKQNRYLSNFLFEIPLISSFYKKVYELKTIYIIHSIVKCKISLQRALELASERINNYKYEVVLLKASEAARKHENIAKVLEESKLFKTMSVQIISIGQSMDKLDDILDDLKQFLFISINNICTKISSIVEPLFLISGGIVIGSILMSYFIPIIKTIESIK